MDTSKRPRRRPINKVKYDFFTRPCDYPDDSDGKWETKNPVEPTTGLWYDYPDQGDGEADWYDMMQLFLHHGYDSALGTKPIHHPLMLVEKSYNPPPIRQQVLECLMEEMNVPAAFLAKDATLACYGCGNTKGTVVDIGYGGTVVTPVFDGYVEEKGIRKSPMGILAMDQAILTNLDHLSKPSPFLPLIKYASSADVAMPFIAWRVSMWHVKQGKLGLDRLSQQTVSSLPFMHLMFHTSYRMAKQSTCLPRCG